MNRTDFLGLISDPYHLIERDQKVLEELLKEFPYAASLHLLQARALHNLNHIQFGPALKKAAAYAGDRSVLYRLIRETPVRPAEVAEARPEPAVPDQFKEETPVQVENPEKALPHFRTFTEWLHDTSHTTEEAPVSKKAPEPVIEDELERLYQENIFHIEQQPGAQTVEFKLESKTDDVIERFLSTQPVMRPPEEKQISTENKARKSAEDEGDLVSETLALIYLTQKHFDKAISVYEKLSLKFPEKKTYFASLIQKIRSDHQLT